MNFRTFYEKGSHPLLWADSRTACEKIRVIGVSNRLNYCVISTVYRPTRFTNVAVGRIIQARGSSLETNGINGLEKTMCFGSDRGKIIVIY
jgi:hypothetical protein